MRVLYLTEEPITFSGTMVRGGQIHVRNVVEGLRERGHEVALIDWNSEPERSFQFSVDPRTRFVDGPLRTTTRALSVGRRRDADVVVSKTRKTYLPGLVAARLLGVPHVVHVGSSLDRPVADVPDQLNMASFVARLRAPHDGYFVVCEHIAAQLCERGIERQRIYDVRNAVDPDRFHPTEVPVPLADRFRRRIDELEDDTFRVGYVGGLQSYKGLDDLVSALDHVEGGCHVIVAGDGPERDRLERAFGERATFLGSVPYEQVPALYREFDTFVLPSHTEGLPRVVLEAQAAGVPVVATRVGGVPEIVTDGETGLLVDPERPDQLGEAIDELIGDSELRSVLSENARDEVVDSYRWSSMYDRYERFLGEVTRSSETS